MRMHVRYVRAQAVGCVVHVDGTWDLDPVDPWVLGSCVAPGTLGMLPAQQRMWQGTWHCEKGPGTGDTFQTYEIQISTAT